MKFAIQCKASKLYLSNLTPCRAAIEVTPVQQVALQFKTHVEATTAVDSIKTLFGSFDWKVAKVQP